jgi:hypothetical protein
MGLIPNGLDLMIRSSVHMRIYAIDILKDFEDKEIHEQLEDIEDKDFINIAEKQGFVWSLEGFINALNRSIIWAENIDSLWFRVIDSKENA